MSNPALAGTNRWPYYDRLDNMLGFTPKTLALDQRDCADTTLSGSEPMSSQEGNPKSKETFTEPVMECEGESEMPAAVPLTEDRDVSPDVGEGDQEQGVPHAAAGNRKDSKTDASEVNTMLNMPGTSGAKTRSKLPVRGSLPNPGVLLVSTLMPGLHFELPMLAHGPLLFDSFKFCATALFTDFANQECRRAYNHRLTLNLPCRPTVLQHLLRS